MLKLNLFGGKKYFKKEDLETVLKEVEKELGKDLSGYLNVIFVDEKEIRVLNKRYRNTDSPTDVLSFIYNNEECKGEILISSEYIKKQILRGDEFPDVPLKYYNKDSGSRAISREKVEILKVLIHGFLHIFGFDHQNLRDKIKMEEKERKIFNRLIPKIS